MAIHHNKRQLTVRKIANYISLPCRWESTLWMRRQWHCGCHKATNLRQYRQVEGAREGEMCVHVFYRHCHRKASLAAGNQRQALGNKRLQNLEKPNWKPLDAWWSGLPVQNKSSKDVKSPTRQLSLDELWLGKFGVRFDWSDKLQLMRQKPQKRNLVFGFCFVTRVGSFVLVRPIWEARMEMQRETEMQICIILCICWVHRLWTGSRMHQPGSSSCCRLNQLSAESMKPCS